MKTFENVGRMGNLAQSLLLYIQKTRFCRKSASRFLHNSQNPNAIPKTPLSANSVNFCKIAENPGHPKSLISHLPIVFRFSLSTLYFVLRTSLPSIFSSSLILDPVSCILYLLLVFHFSFCTFHFALLTSLPATLSPLAFPRTSTPQKRSDLSIFSLEISQVLCYKVIDTITRFAHSCDISLSFRLGRHRPVKSYKDIACHNCGAVLPMEISNMPTEEKKIWYPGKKCPICGSQEFFPSIKSSGPVEKEPVKGWRYNSWYGISAMAVVVILIPVYFLLRRPATIAARTTVVSCTECDAASEAQVRKKPPYACPV